MWLLMRGAFFLAMFHIASSSLSCATSGFFIPNGDPYYGIDSLDGLNSLPSDAFRDFEDARDGYIFALKMFNRESTLKDFEQIIASLKF